jgi:hypothetical protein
MAVKTGPEHRKIGLFIAVKTGLDHRRLADLWQYTQDDRQLECLINGSKDRTTDSLGWLIYGRIHRNTDSIGWLISVGIHRITDGIGWLISGSKRRIGWMNMAVKAEVGERSD